MPATTLTPGLPNARLGRFNEQFPLADYLVDPAGRFVVCAIPKNGCTTLKQWFLSVVEPDAPRDREVHLRCRTRYSVLLSPPEQRASILGCRPCVAFVRDPIRRLASVYANKFVALAEVGCFEGARELMEEHARRRGVEVRFDTTSMVELAGRLQPLPSSSSVDYARGLTFREFVNLVCDLPDDALDPHWRPQSGYLRPLGTPPDVLMPLSKLAPTLNALSARLGLNALPISEQAATADKPSPDAWTGRLADVPSGTLAAFSDGGEDLPGAEALYDQNLLERARERFLDDLRLIETVQTRKPSSAGFPSPALSPHPTPANRGPFGPPEPNPLAPAESARRPERI